jgi:hypothetical protein
MPLVIAVGATFSAIGLCQGRNGGAGVYLVAFERGQDGTINPVSSDVHPGPFAVTVTVRVTDIVAPSNGWLDGGDACWTTTHWWLDVKSAEPLSQDDRGRIAALAFRYTGRPMPAGSGAVPPPGETAVSGDVTTVRCGRVAVWLLTGVPGFLVVGWLAVGLAVWLTRNDRRRGTFCAGCGYDRAGLALGAVCPECGKLP